MSQWGSQWVKLSVGEGDTGDSEALPHPFSSQLRMAEVLFLPEKSSQIWALVSHSLTTHTRCVVSTAVFS